MKWFKRIALLLGLLLLTTYLIVMFCVMPDLPQQTLCQNIEVRVLDSAEVQFVTKQDILQRLGQIRAKYEGVTFEKIDLHELERLVCQNSMIYEATCYPTQSGTLRIDVTQRRPLFRVMSSTGNFYIDDKRQPMSTSLHCSAYVPVVTGFVDEEFLCGPFYDFVESILDDDFWCNQITQFYIYPNHEVELVPRVGDQVVMLGKLDNAERKMDKLLTFYKKAMPHVGWNRYKRIDLRYRNQVVCTKREP